MLLKNLTKKKSLQFLEKMFIKLLKPLQINNKYEVRFMFQNAGSILLKIPVKGRITTPEKKKAHHHH